jgi:hypothetical protein
MIVRIISTAHHHAALAIQEDYDGVNPPASLSLYVNDDGNGNLKLNLEGGDPDAEDSDQPTIVKGVYHGDERTFEAS